MHASKSLLILFSVLSCTLAGPVNTSKQDDNGSSDPEARSLSARGKQYKKTHPWNTKRIGQNKPVTYTKPTDYGKLLFTYEPPFENEGKGVDIIALGKGFDPTHPDLFKRPFSAMLSKAATNKKEVEKDKLSMTSLASIVYGKNTGGAKQAGFTVARVVNYKSVPEILEIFTKVKGTLSSSSAAKKKRNTKKSPILILPFNFFDGRRFNKEEEVKALGEALSELSEAGVHILMPSGNEGKDICKIQDANMKKFPKLVIITVASSDPTDKFYVKANYGPCIDLYAPGHDVLVANAVSKKYSLESDTRYAATHVAVLVAMLESDKHHTPKEMLEMVVAMATEGTQERMAGTTNKIISGKPPSKAAAANAEKEKQVLEKYGETWGAMKAGTLTKNSLTLKTFPWPVFKLPSDPESVTERDVKDFMSNTNYPFKKDSVEKTFKFALPRWHPDEYDKKWKAFVVEADQEKAGLYYDTLVKVIIRTYDTVKDSNGNGKGPMDFDKGDKKPNIR